ncbi:hypothetical protein [Nocardia terpenica]|uniref:Uncharacterized protein n=1 Tax=Nocardia terpenica TaxID=455432 RepID=A0A161XFP5_9NOCA|nr:hypothetical protein [Nocardia terpenica]KZM72248.1 hypothetical protein AWN90_36855 [Nocardia terpenica]NQE86606.1 hypothetical protein [Nocardia terpenica]
MADLKLFTINVSGAERHDGEKPYTYAMRAESMKTAKRLAWLYHLWLNESEEGTVAADGTVPGAPEAENRLTRSDSHADVVVIDCEEFPCHEGAPFECGDPAHYEWGAKSDGSCRCDYYWFRLSPGRTKWPVHPLKNEARLRELGYKIQRKTPEETTW